MHRPTENGPFTQFALNSRLAPWLSPSPFRGPPLAVDPPTPLGCAAPGTCIPPALERGRFQHPCSAQRPGDDPEPSSPLHVPHSPLPQYWLEPDGNTGNGRFQTNPPEGNNLLFQTVILRAQSFSKNILRQPKEYQFFGI